MAPEIFRKSGHGKPVDVWAIGVITYFLLCGYTPFDRDSNLEEMQAILVADYSFTPVEYWRGVSQTARRFIQACLTIDPNKRMTAHEALSHEWIAGPESGRGEEDLLPTVKKNFNARRTLHKAIDTVRAINQLRAGGLGMMDGAQSTNPKRADAFDNAKPKDEDVNMEDIDPPGGPNDQAIVIDPRGHGRGQTEAQIAEQQRRIEEATQGIWKGRVGQAA
jgi:serine/threonine protein kinase